MNKLCRLTSLATLLVAALPAAAKCLHYDLPAVELAGQLERVATPSGGRVAPEDSWFFKPVQPLCVSAGAKRLGNDSVRNVRRFEVLLPSDASFNPLVGAPVVIRGWFVPTKVPHPHPLTFSVESARSGHAP